MPPPPPENSAARPGLRPGSLYYGDCLEVMRGWPDGLVDLIYLDPPFNSQANYNQLFGTENGVPAQVRAFSDTWKWDRAAAERLDNLSRSVAHRAHRAVAGLHGLLGESGMLAYLTYMAERLAECRRMLRPGGSIYLHCDPTAGHYLKVLMDSILGARNFRNEIVWKRNTGHNSGAQFGRIHDTILFYTLGDGWTWNRTHARSYSPAQLARFRKDADGREYKADDLTAARPSSGSGKFRWRGTMPGPTRGWAYGEEQLEALLAEGRILLKADGTPRLDGLKVYLDELPGPRTQSIWDDIPRIPNTSRERLGYPTQKPVALLERIIRASSNRGDLVLDPFCGCGTTIDAARRLGRRWAGIDISPFATRLVRDTRLKDGSIPILGIPTDMDGAVQLLNRNPFDFEAWIVSSVPGLAPNEKRTGDRGIDGRGRSMSPDPDGRNLVVAQVKGGGYSATALRDFERVMDRERAMAGVFIALRHVTARPARAAAAAAGTFMIGADAYPRLQFWSVEEYLAGHVPRLPSMADPYTGKPVQMDAFTAAPQGGLFG